MSIHKGLQVGTVPVNHSKDGRCQSVRVLRHISKNLEARFASEFGGLTPSYQYCKQHSQYT